MPFDPKMMKYGRVYRPESAVWLVTYKRPDDGLEETSVHRDRASATSWMQKADEETMFGQAGASIGEWCCAPSPGRPGCIIHAWFGKGDPNMDPSFEVELFDVEEY